MQDNVFSSIQQAITSLGRRIRNLETLPRSGNCITISTASLSIPPTDAELDAEFGEPADITVGFVRLLDIGGAHTNLYLITSDGTKWWYVAMAEAA